MLHVCGNNVCTLNEEQFLRCVLSRSMSSPHNDSTNTNNFSTFSTCFSSLLFPPFPHVPPSFITIIPFARHLAAPPPPPPPRLSHADRWFSAASSPARSKFTAFRAERWVRFWSNRLPRRTCFCVRLRLSAIRFVRTTCSLKLLKGKREKKV